MWAMGSSGEEPPAKLLRRRDDETTTVLTYALNAGQHQRPRRLRRQHWPPAGVDRAHRRCRRLEPNTPLLLGKKLRRLA